MKNCDYLKPLDPGANFRKAMDKDFQKHLQSIKEKVAKWPKERREAALAFIRSRYCRIKY